MTSMKRGTGQGVRGTRRHSDRLRFGWWRAALLFVCAGAGAGEFALPQQGWVSWRVDAVEGAPDACCFGPDQPGAAGTCDLDRRRQSWTSNDAHTTTEVVVYAKLVDGQAIQARAYGPNCPVRAASPIADLGKLDAEASARWLAGQLPADGERASEFLAALAMHRGEAAGQALLAIAQDRQAGERRRDALFWLGHARGEAGVRSIEPLLRSDPDPDIREHAAFAVAQSKSARRGQLLLEQARTDASRQVRSQAWFWLAQTGDPGAEQALRDALHAEDSQEVRHQAIFAASQLPDDRAAAALIAFVEDRALPIEDRKQALFWLGQSESSEAIAYLDRVLR